jgi:hypothetical protein
MTAYGVATTKSGRAGIAFPLDWLLKASTFVMTFIICGIALLMWGIMEFWHTIALVIALSFWSWQIIKRIRRRK